MITISRANPLSPDALVLIAGSEADLSGIYPPEARFAFSPQQLVDENVRFFVARRGSVAMGCCGYAVYDGYGELKRMYVIPGARGTGIAPALLAHVEAAAKSEKMPLMRLETGTESPAALTVYARNGYVKRGPFGDYPENASSVFMEKPL